MGDKESGGEGEGGGGDWREKWRCHSRWKRMRGDSKRRRERLDK